MSSDSPPEPWRSRYCAGELCQVENCLRPATAKVAEEVPDDDPIRMRHPLTSYLCAHHFGMIMGTHGVTLTETLRQAYLATNPERPE